MFLYRSGPQIRDEKLPEISSITLTTCKPEEPTHTVLCYEM